MCYSYLFDLKWKTSPCRWPWPLTSCSCVETKPIKNLFLITRTETVIMCLLKQRPCWSCSCLSSVCPLNGSLSRRLTKDALKPCARCAHFINKLRRYESGFMRLPEITGRTGRWKAAVRFHQQLNREGCNFYLHFICRINRDRVHLFTNTQSRKKGWLN